MYSLNRVQLVGYLTEAPSVRKLPTGTTVADLNLRISSPVTKENGEIINTTSFHSVTLWSGLAEIMEKYTSAGSQIYVEGRLKTESWETEEGNKRYKTKVIGDDVILLTPATGAYPPLPDSSAFGSGMNTVSLVGNLTKDLEVRQTPNGTSVGSSSVATSRKWKDKNSGENKEETEFHNIVVWGKLASEGEMLLKKGRKVLVVGRVQSRSWETPTGEKRSTTEVIADRISVLGHENAHIGSSEIPSGYQASADGNTSYDVPEIPTISYENGIKPEDLPF